MTYPHQPLDDNEWRYIAALLANEYDCNENPTAMSALKKITGVSSTGGDNTITSAVRFFAHDERIREQAVNGPVGKQLGEYGFEPWHTGGGIYVWGRSIQDGYDLYVTGADGELGESLDEVFFLGVYDADGQQVASIETADVSDALEYVGRCVADPAAFIKKYPSN